MSTTINEKPILFSAPMVRAILDGTKTQTRRIIKPAPPHWIDELHGGQFRQRAPYDLICPEKEAKYGFGFEDEGRAWKCPYGQPGDRLWVREAWAPAAVLHQKAFICFRADGEIPNAERSTEVLLDSDEALLKAHRDLEKGHWIPGIHMHRWASRITLEIESIRVERLNDISEMDAQAEGCGASVDYTRGRTYRSEFQSLWESINGPGSWDANPWVWVVTFKRL